MIIQFKRRVWAPVGFGRIGFGRQLINQLKVVAAGGVLAMASGIPQCGASAHLKCAVCACAHGLESFGPVSFVYCLHGRVGHRV